MGYTIYDMLRDLVHKAGWNESEQAKVAEYRKLIDQLETAMPERAPDRRRSILPQRPRKK